MQSEEKPGRIDTVVVSDLHLGSYYSRASLLLKVLRSLQFKRLVLLGDIFDHRFKAISLTAAGVEFINYLAELSLPASGIEVVWISGNHDPKGPVILPALNQEVYESYQWEAGGANYLAVHGDKYDGFWSRHESFAIAFDTVIEFLLVHFDSKQKIYHLVKRHSAIWTQVADKVAVKALATAKIAGVDYVFCGHVHMPSVRGNGSSCYVNSGCWVDNEPSLIAVCSDGPFLHKYSPAGELIEIISPGDP